jgi:hypothetical protein
VPDEKDFYASPIRFCSFGFNFRDFVGSRAFDSRSAEIGRIGAALGCHTAAGSIGIEERRQFRGRSR